MNHQNKSICRCMVCGGDVFNIAVPGRRIDFRGIKNLNAPDDLAVPTCTTCGEELIDSESAQRIDQAMDPLYRAYLRKIAKESIYEITRASISQCDLERALGLTQGYITKLKTGKRTPSLAFAVHLAHIATNPKKNLNQIEKVLTAH